MTSRKGLPFSDDVGDEALSRLTSENTLAPGQYWRVVKPIKIKDPRGTFHSDGDLCLNDLHLITELFEFEGLLHSITFLEHPRGVNKDRFGTHTLLTADFFEVFEPVPLADAKTQRSREQAAIMDEIAAVQDEMHRAQVNPLALPEVQEAAKAAVEKFEAGEIGRVQAEVKDIARREADLRRLHRRSARRAEAKGNPLAIRKATISDRLDVMLSEGVTSDGVRDLQLEAGRRLAIATAASKWLVERSKKMSEILERVTPYLAEMGQLALASASSAIERVGEIERGITSLKLYTGDGISVVPVREGTDAATSVPLTIVQQKLAMDEELAVSVDVEDDFDCNSQLAFFQRLATDDRLLDQIMPTQRCVVSMQTTRRRIEYGKDVHPFEAVMRAIENKRVFLLVRNGQNVHAVYSSEPSHEAATRLFPTEAEIRTPFKGIDGSSIGLQDVAFGKSSKAFEDQALHYRRFLILLCGLDHRLGLFGEFFPPEERTTFMSLPFQGRYFRFLENDDPSRLLGGKTESVHSWMERHNAAMRSGSRVVVQSGTALANAAAHVSRSRSIRIDTESTQLTDLIASDKNGALMVSIPTVNIDTDRKGGATVWLTGNDAYRGTVLPHWFLCVDRVTLPEVRSYIYDRQQRIGSISWLRTLRRVEAALIADERHQEDLKTHLRESALAAKIHTEDTVDEAIAAAIATWRCDHRGAHTPSLADHVGMGQLLSLVYPKHHLASSMDPLIVKLCEREGLEPLMLARTGKNQLALYSVTPERDRAPYGTGVRWGWVRRHLIKVGQSRASLGSASTVWLERKAMGLTEEMVSKWPLLDQWVHDEPEPVRLPVLAKAIKAMTDGQDLINRFHETRIADVPLEDAIVQSWLSELGPKARKLRYSQTPYITVVLGVIQKTKNCAPQFLCARASLLQILSAHGTPSQRDQLAGMRGFRSEMIGKRLREPASRLSWRPMVSSELPSRVADLEESMVAGKTPSWSTIETNKPGGLSHSFFGFNRTTRAQRREKGGDPCHEETKATLSWNRAIDTLMGIQPLQRKRFYAKREHRSDRVWSGLSDDGTTLEERRKAERNRQYEPPRPVAIQLTACLWNTVLGRSIANKFFHPAACRTRPAHYSET